MEKGRKITPNPSLQNPPPPPDFCTSQRFYFIFRDELFFLSNVERLSEFFFFFLSLKNKLYALSFFFTCLHSQQNYEFDPLQWVHKVFRLL